LEHLGGYKKPKEENIVDNLTHDQSTDPEKK
jgi:hypothetical protein